MLDMKTLVQKYSHRYEIQLLACEQIELSGVFDNI